LVQSPDRRRPLEDLEIEGDNIKIGVKEMRWKNGLDSSGSG
jgi:hypothetical protein